MNNTDSSDDIAERAWDEGSNHGRCGVEPLLGWKWVDPVSFADPSADECVVVVKLAARLSASLRLGGGMTHGLG